MATTAATSGRPSFHAGNLERILNNVHNLDPTTLDARRDRAYQWWIRLGMPEYEKFVSTVTTTSGLDITAADVDLLPWAVTATGRKKVCRDTYKSVQAEAAARQKQQARLAAVVVPTPPATPIAPPVVVEEIAEEIATVEVVEEESPPPVPPHVEDEDASVTEEEEELVPLAEPLERSLSKELLLDLSEDATDFNASSADFTITDSMMDMSIGDMTLMSDSEGDENLNDTPLAPQQAAFNLYKQLACPRHAVLSKVISETKGVDLTKQKIFIETLPWNDTATAVQEDVMKKAVGDAFDRRQQGVKDEEQDALDAKRFRTYEWYKRLAKPEKPVFHQVLFENTGIDLSDDDEIDINLLPWDPTHTFVMEDELDVTVVEEEKRVAAERDERKKEREKKRRAQKIMAERKRIVKEKLKKEKMERLQQEAEDAAKQDAVDAAKKEKMDRMLAMKAVKSVSNMFRTKPSLDQDGPDAQALSKDEVDNSSSSNNDSPRRVRGVFSRKSGDLKILKESLSIESDTALAPEISPKRGRGLFARKSGDLSTLHVGLNADSTKNDPENDDAVNGLNLSPRRPMRTPVLRKGSMAQTNLTGSLTSGSATRNASMAHVTTSAPILETPALRNASIAHVHMSAPTTPGSGGPAIDPESDEGKVRKVRAFYTWGKWAQPTRDKYKQKVTAATGCSVTTEDVDMLPWIFNGSLVNTAKMGRLVQEVNAKGLYTDSDPAGQ